MDESTTFRYRRTEQGEPDGMDMFHQWGEFHPGSLVPVVRQAYSRVNYQLPDTASHRIAETRAFIRRREQWPRS